jgi:hypothetical protein
MAKKEEKANPEAKDWETSLIDLIDEEWEKGSQYCSDLNELYNDVYAMMRGERPIKNYDWESNVVINKVFQVVWSAISYLTNKIFGATPVIAVKSFDKNGAWQRETILEFWHTLQVASDKEHVDYFLIVVMWLLRGLLNGTGILKKTWHQKLKRISQDIKNNVPVRRNENGEIEYEEVTTKQTRTVPLEDWPHNEVVNNKDIVVDWNLKPGQSIKHGRFVIHRVPNKDIDALEKTGLYENLDSFTGATESDIDQEHSAAKVDQQTPPPKSSIYTEIDVYERVGQLPVTKTDEGWEYDPDGDMKHMVATVGKGGDVSRIIYLKPNRYEMINYIDMQIYFDEERWQSVGMAEPIMDLQTALNDNINATFDSIWQNLFPPTVFNDNFEWNWDTIKYAPHQKWIGSFPINVPPSAAVHFKEPSSVTSDAWRRHALFDSEIQQTSVTNAVQGVAKEKTATTNMLNAQMSAGKLDFILRMVEKTALIPSAQMDIAFAKKFAHPLTFAAILGKQFRLSDWEEIYRYSPAASSVKLELQKESEVQQDTQLLQIIGSIKNPNAVKIMNVILKNIFRNRNWTELEGMLDENFYEPSSDTGEIQMMNRMQGASNEQGIPMSPMERGVRERANG